MALESSQSSNTESSKTWLVKSGDRILGPFTTEIITQMILGRELVILDEVTPPDGRWRFIRDVPAFRSIVEEARKNIMNAREETEIGGFDNTADTTNPADAIEAARMTSARADDHGIRDAEFEDVPSESSPAVSQNQSRQFGLRNAKTAASAKRSSQSIAMWIAAAIVVVCALYMILAMRKPAAQRGIASLDFDRAAAAAERAWRRGDFLSAERLYRQANGQKPNQPAIVAKLAPLMIQLEGSTVEAKRLLMDTKASAEKKADRQILTDLHLASALAAMYSGDLANAKSLYETALYEESARLIAQFNLGMIEYLQGNHEKALTRFSASGSSALVKFMSVRTLMSMPKRRGGRKEAAAILLSLTKSEFDFYQEGQLLSALVLLESGNKKASETRIKMVLDADPEMTANHWHDPLVFQSETAWRSLLGICEKLDKGLNSDLSRGLMAFCLAKTGQTDAAITSLNAAMSTNNENETLQAINAFVLYSTNREADARAAIRIATSQSPAPILAQILKARLCFRANEIECAESQWTPLSNSAGTERLAALVGLAHIAHRKGEKEKAQELTAKAAALSSTYKPAMRFREGDDV